MYSSNHFKKCPFYLSYYLNQLTTKLSIDVFLFLDILLFFISKNNHIIIILVSFDDLLKSAYSLNYF